MKQYKDIPIWENIRRTKILYEFKTLATEYFKNISDLNQLEALNSTNSQIENNAIETRSKINKRIKEVNDIIMASNVSVFLHYTPSPAIGGMTVNIDVIDNIFNLHYYDIELRHVIDITEQSIGVYELDRRRTWCRTINPFYWIIEILDTISSYPFKLLSKAGFNQNKIEHSAIGKIVKAGITLITAIAGFLTILEKLDYLEWFKNNILHSLCN